MHFVKEPYQLTDEELRNQIETLEEDQRCLYGGYPLDINMTNLGYYQRLCGGNLFPIEDRLEELFKERELRGIKDRSL